MPRKPGTPKTGGRTKGSRNKKTEEQVKAVEETGITPLEYMLTVLRDKDKDDATRLDAANKAAPYVHPKLSSIEMRADVNQYANLEDDELDERIRELVTEAGISLPAGGKGKKKGV